MSILQLLNALIRHSSIANRHIKRNSEGKTLCKSAGYKPLGAVAI